MALGDSRYQPQLPGFGGGGAPSAGAGLPVPANMDQSYLDLLMQAAGIQGGPGAGAGGPGAAVQPHADQLRFQQEAGPRRALGPGAATEAAGAGRGGSGPRVGTARMGPREIEQVRQELARPSNVTPWSGHAPGSMQGVYGRQRALPAGARGIGPGPGSGAATNTATPMGPGAMPMGPGAGAGGAGAGGPRSPFSRLSGAAGEGRGFWSPGSSGGASAGGATSGAARAAASSAATGAAGDLAARTLASQMGDWTPRVGSWAARRAAAGAPQTWLSARLGGASGQVARDAGLGLRSFGQGSLGRASLYSLAGQAGKWGFDQLYGDRDGTWDDAIGTGIATAGVGAGIGSMIAPGIGTAIGGGIGAIGGGVWGALRGTDSKATQLTRAAETATGQLDERLSELDASDNLKSLAREQLVVMLGMANSPDEVKAITNEVLGMVAAELPMDRERERINKHREAAAAAVQAWAGPQMQQMLDRHNLYALQQQGVLNELADQYGDSQGQLAAATRAYAADIPMQASRAGLGYIGQLASIPEFYGYASENYGDPLTEFDVAADVSDQELALMAQLGMTG